MTGDQKSIEAKRKAAELRDDVIEHLYEVAMDPMRYEDLLDRWETMIKPIRKGANGMLIDADINAEYSAHFSRADKFLKHLEAPQKPQGPISHIEKTAAFLIGHGLHFAEVNDASTNVFSISKGDHISALPLEPSGLDELSNTILMMLNSNTNIKKVFRAHTIDEDRVVVFQLHKLNTDDGPPLVVSISSEVTWPSGFNDLLISAFELTPTEAEIMRALAENQSLRDIANTRKRSIDTVRAQLKSVLAKTETHTQNELVSLTYSMLDIAVFTEDKGKPARSQSGGAKHLVPLPYHQVTLPDGRLVEYLILGDPKGKPLLFYPQDYGLTRWGLTAEAEAKKRGIKVISIVRAGYGGADALPKKVDLGATIAQDTGSIMDHLGIDKCPVVSFGSDVFHAYHLYNQFPERITAIIACAGTFPYENAAQYERMHKWYRFILASARYTPHLVPFMVKAGFMLARKLGKKGFVNAVFGDSAADVETYKNPEVFEAMEYGSEICLTDNFMAHKMFSAEVIAQESHQWGGLIENTKNSVPVYYFSGADDPQTPIETLLEMMGKYDWINYTVYEDAGQLVFFKKWYEIFPTIEKYL